MILITFNDNTLGAGFIGNKLHEAGIVYEYSRKLKTYKIIIYKSEYLLKIMTQFDIDVTSYESGSSDVYCVYLKDLKPGMYGELDEFC